MRQISATNVWSLAPEVVKDYMRVFACDDSELGSWRAIISSESFEPDSFTIKDRLARPGYLTESERDFHDWSLEIILDQLHRISESENIRFDGVEAVALRIQENLQVMMRCPIGGVQVQDTIWNQELIDVLRRVVAFSLVGNPNVTFRTHHRFNRLANRVMPLVIRRIREESHPLDTLLRAAIASGLSGLDLKGAGAACSAFSNVGIPMAHYFDMSPEDAADAYYACITKQLASPAPVFQWQRFASTLAAHNNFVRLAWLTDDYIETLFDLLFIDRLLEAYPNVVIDLIPRNGTHGNDASWSDVADFLKLDVFRELNSYVTEERLCVCRQGPSMGTVNLRKLSVAALDLLARADYVIVKGCRTHEMIQGGLNRPSFTMYVVSREYTESATGFDARESPLLFFYLDPGEYASYGFKWRHLRTKEFSDGRQIWLCKSTLEDHYRRTSVSEPPELVEELRAFQASLGHEGIQPELSEANRVAERLLEETRKTYDAICENYASTRGREPREADKQGLRILLALARERTNAGGLGNEHGILSILDVGTGSGRDLRFISKIRDVRIVGIDNSDGFIEILRRLESAGEIPAESHRKADMRYLCCFADGSFDIVRHNATLVHMPIIASGYMADLAVSESHRVLKFSGLLFVSVKEGTGIDYVDTGDGCGRRFFQFYSMKSIEDLLSRNGFGVVASWKGPSSRGKDVTWIYLIGEKRF